MIDLRRHLTESSLIPLAFSYDLSFFINLGPKAWIILIRISFHLLPFQLLLQLLILPLLPCKHLFKSLVHGQISRNGGLVNFSGFFVYSICCRGSGGRFVRRFRPICHTYNKFISWYRPRRSSRSCCFISLRCLISFQVIQTLLVFSLRFIFAFLNPILSLLLLSVFFKYFVDCHVKLLFALR